MEKMKKNLLLLACVLAMVGCKQNQTEVAETVADDVVELDMDAINAQVDFVDEADHFTQYAKVTVDGEPMLLFSDEDGNAEAIFFSSKEGVWTLVAELTGPGRLEVYENGVRTVEGCGSGCSTTNYYEKDEEADYYHTSLSHYQVVDPDDNVVEQTYELVGYDDEFSDEEGASMESELLEAYGALQNQEDLNWTPLEE